MGSTFYRIGVLTVKALNEYTETGYNSACKKFESLEGIDISGRSYLITGANSGIGKETALALAKLGATVHMVCRSEERGKEAFEEIKKESGSESIHLHILDISEPRKVDQFTREFVSANKPINVLVNNAGCVANSHETTCDGLEKNFATNTLGTYMLTTGLIEHMKKYDAPQVIIVTSGTMLLQKLDSSDLQFERMSPFDGRMAYAQTKRQQVVMADQWTKQNSKIQFTTMHSGLTDTPLLRSSYPDVYRRVKDRLRTLLQGADTLIWLCVSSSARDQPSGGFYQDRIAVSKHLPLAWTKSSEEEETEFMKKLEEISVKFRTQAS